MKTKITLGILLGVIVIVAAVLSMQLVYTSAVASANGQAAASAQAQAAASAQEAANAKAQAAASAQEAANAQAQAAANAQEAASARAQATARARAVYQFAVPKIQVVVALRNHFPRADIRLLGEEYAFKLPAHGKAYSYGRYVGDVYVDEHLRVTGGGGYNVTNVEILQ